MSRVTSSSSSSNPVGWKRGEKSGEAPAEDVTSTVGDQDPGDDNVEEWVNTQQTSQKSEQEVRRVPVLCHLKW